MSHSRLCLFALVAMLASFTNQSLADSSEERISEFRREATNLQFNKDGTVGLIRLSKPTVNDDVLAKLQQFPQLKYLAVVSPNVTDTGILQIAGLKELDTLLIAEANVTSESIPAIGELPNLERITLNQLPLDEIPAETISKLPNLTALSLAETNIGDASLVEISKIENLQTLVLDHTQVTDAGLAHLANLQQLSLLSLCECNVRGQSLSAFQNHASLKHLILSGTVIGESELSQVATIKSLETLELYDTNLTAAAVETLRQSLVETKIFFRDASATEIDRPLVAQQSSAGTSSTDLGPVRPPISDQIDEHFVPSFQRHVIPLLGRLGCNSRSCHGSFQGRGGFRLSMFGYDFDLDHENLLDRIDVDQPTESLVLHKPASDEDHEGGKRFERGSWQQLTLQRWIESGAANRPADPPKFERLEIQPAEINFADIDQTEQLQVVAVWSNGDREDVTCLSRFESKDDRTADVNADGLVIAKDRGDTQIIVYYDNGIEPVPVFLPLVDQPKPHRDRDQAPNSIDEFIAAKLTKLGLDSSPLSGDEEFLRRVSLDLIGTLPTPAEIESFVADSDPDKRPKKIDQLLEHPAYVAWWTNRLCDLTGSNAGYLGGTEMARPVSYQWQDWIERRVRDNIGWDQIVYDLVTSTSRRPGQTYREFAAQQSQYTRRVEPADFAAAGNPMPHYWFRDNIKVPADKALSFGYIFMGMRLDCAQCHKHPFDRWSQSDFEGFTEFFTRIQTGVAPDAQAMHEEYRQMLGVPTKLDTAALRRQSYLRIAAEGRPIPWREVWIEPAKANPQMAKFLGGQEIDLSQVEDPRIPLADWLRSEPNRYLAKAFVNRVWANYFGQGMVHPTDDLNLANPASHPALLDFLAEQFVQHEYDIKWLHRTIAGSRSYQLSWRPTRDNLQDQRNHSHATLRRLPAEVIIDAIYQATTAEKTLNTIGKQVDKRKISQHPLSYQTRSIDYSLLVFGKSLRSTNCDCETNLAPTLPQALYIRNDSELLELFDRADGWLSELTRVDDGDLDLANLIQSAYLRTLSRPPTANETLAAEEHFVMAESKVDALRDLLWALLNTQEFITNH